MILVPVIMPPYYASGDEAVVSHLLPPVIQLTPVRSSLSGVR